MEIEKPFACASPLVISIVMAVICFCSSNGYSQQQNASLSVEFELAQPLGVVRYQLDGTDAGYVLSGNETCDLGYVDSMGAPISGAPAGDPNVNGTAGVPVDSSGAPLGGFYDPGCIGAFYPLFAAAGGDNNEQHPNSALCIFLHLTGNPTWSLSTSAQLLGSTANVTVGQLKWKLDATTANGFQGYTAFTTSSTVIASGSRNVRDYFYIDYGLLVENVDAPGANVWLVTYTLVEI